MKKKQRLSVLLIIVMLCTMTNVGSLNSYAAVSTMSHAMDVISTGLNQAINVIKGPDGKLYISEYGGGKITRVDLDGQNKEDFATGLNQPIGMVFDNGGNLYVAEHAGSKIQKITSGGVKSPIKEGTGILTGIIIDSNDKLYAAEYGTGKILKMNLDGSGSTEFITGLGTNTIIGMTIDSNDNIYIADRSGGKIRKITPSATVTDFITGLSTPTWVTFGKDGYFYVSLGSRIIEKYDTSGNKVNSFVTPATLGYPWGTYIEDTGYIYFQTMGSVTEKIVGTGGTTDKTHIELIMNTTMPDVTVDSAAFTVSGIASNPQVTAATTSGSSLYLTLDDNISYTDTSIKLSYAKTGTNNLVISGSATELDNFTNMPIKNNVLRITNISTLSNITVSKGTELSGVMVQLPSTATLTLSNSTTTSAAVTWDGGTPPYDGNISGTYIFGGTVATTDNVSNSSNLKASVTVIVAEADKPNISAVATLPDIFVTNGTQLSAVNLPNSVTVTLDNATTTSAALALSVNNSTTTGAAIDLGSSNSTTTGAALSVILSSLTTISAPVTWDGGTPPYNATTAGTYVFSGTIVLGDEFFNPSNLKASVNVIVGAASSGKDSSSPTPPPVNNNTIIKVNGEDQRIGIESKSIENGVSKVEVSVNSGVMEKVIDAAIKASTSNPTGTINLVEINVVDQTANIALVSLTGEIVKKLDQNNFDVLIKKGDVAYNIPAKEFTVDAVAQKLAVSQERLQDIKFEIQIKQFSKEQQEIYANQIKANNGEMLIPPMAFDVVAKVTRTDGTSQDVVIKSFEQYVERIFEIPSTLNPNDITTGIVFNENQTYNHVPTNVFIKDGKYYAQVSSLTNSTYSVIKNPIQLDVVKGHWSESAVNDMASRLVLVDYKEFKPNSKVTRGELAEYLVRALGIYREDYSVSSKFKDVKETDPHAKGIVLATEWKIISGYADGTFKGNSFVTREEAMAMYANAMDIAKYSVPVNGASDLANLEGASGWSKAAVKKVLESKIFNGRTDGKLGLKDPITHAEALTAIKNFLSGANLINK